jgi:GTP cyclohydrolase I
MQDPLDEAARALRDFLAAIGVPLGSDPELEATPRRAAQAFRDELLDGYRGDPGTVLAESLPTTDGAVVTLANLAYTSMCPHHLLPTWGRAHVGYLPGGRIVGFGTMVKLVDTLAHRLVLQESLGRQVAEALVTHLGARGAGVVLEAQHACLRARGERQVDAVVVTHAYAGTWQDDPRVRADFLQAVSLAAHGPLR